MPAQFVAIQARDANGNPVPAARFDTWAAGTTTRQAVYQDEALTTPLSNPVIANSAGIIACWMDADRNYKFVLTTADGNTNLFAVVDNYDPDSDNILYIIGSDIETARADAVASKEQAELAQAAAEAAQTAAEAAQTGAEAAETNALSHAGDALTRKNEAETARNQSQAAQSLSEAAQTAAEIARGAAETAEANSQNAQTASEGARDLAQEWATKPVVSGQVAATDYSAKAYAQEDLKGANGGSARDWAATDEDTLVDATNYSAKHYASKASADATTAAGHVTTTGLQADSAALAELEVSKRFLGSHADAAAAVAAYPNAEVGALFWNTTDSASHVINNLSPIGSALLQTLSSNQITNINDIDTLRTQVDAITAIDAATLTISSGAITIPRSGAYLVDTESAAATDDIDSIDVTALREGEIFSLHPVNAARVPTLKNNATLKLFQDLPLGDPERGVWLRKRGATVVRAFDSIFTRRKVSRDTVWRIGPGQEFADFYEAMDGTAGVETIGDNRVIIDPPREIYQLGKQIYLPSHNFTEAQIGSELFWDRRQGVSFVGLTGASAPYEFTFDIPGDPLPVGWLFWVNPSGTGANANGNLGPYWQAAAGFKVKSVSGTEYTCDCNSQVDGLAAITLVNADAFVPRCVLDVRGVVNASLNIVDNPAQTEILDRDNNREILRNLLANPAPATADDQGVFHSNTSSKWFLWDIGVDLSNIAGLNDENRQEHILRAAYGGSLQVRNMVGYGAPKGFALASDRSTISIENSGFADCNRSDKSADGMYSQIGGHIRANSVNGGHQRKAAARAREVGSVDLQNCKLTGADFAVDAEHGGIVTFTGDGRGNATAGVRAINKSHVYIPRFVELSDNPISIIADTRSDISAESLQSPDGAVNYIDGTSGVDIQIDGLASVTLGAHSGLTVNYDGGYFNGQPGANVGGGGGGGGHDGGDITIDDKITMPDGGANNIEIENIAGNPYVSTSDDSKSFYVRSGGDVAKRVQIAPGAAVIIGRNNGKEARFEFTNGEVEFRTADGSSDTRFRRGSDLVASLTGNGLEIEAGNDLIVNGITRLYAEAGELDIATGSNPYTLISDVTTLSQGGFGLLLRRTDNAGMLEGRLNRHSGGAYPFDLENLSTESGVSFSLNGNALQANLTANPWYFRYWKISD